ncbi:hypothetical protein JJB11_21445 [Ramlibacter ginsenosidimutans]|uniref:Metallopeptidase n=1 Tax=Ramlibacter ginsenosidimutans TaxID=502333 RepID=A0A934WNA5_9BURK|nr:DUF4344 domain-containing metallopeptidase [Ramlibacter ginsenosidimutans]MBK6008674.1 hypothetical protein [Ramlibacter ginsenosidimutans]
MEMLKVVCALVLSFGTVSWARAALPLEQLFYKGQAVPFYGTARSERQQELLDIAKKTQFAERMARLVNSAVHLKTNLGVGFASCGQPNAFYDRQRGAVVFCTEMLNLMVNLARSDTDLATADRTSFSRVIDGAVWGIFFHELGHAIIGVNGVPITGREEDVADQFAIYFAAHFVEPQGTPVVQPTIWLFTQMSKRVDIASADQDTIKRLMSNEHSLDQQRIYNLACWALGANSSRGYVSAQYVSLPQERAGRCSNEFATLDFGVRKQFQKFLKVRPQ